MGATPALRWLVRRRWAGEGGRPARQWRDSRRALDRSSLPKTHPQAVRGEQGQQFSRRAPPSAVHLGKGSWQRALGPEAVFPPRPTSAGADINLLARRPEHAIVLCNSIDARSLGHCEQQPGDLPSPHARSGEANPGAPPAFTGDHRARADAGLSQAHRTETPLLSRIRQAQFGASTRDSAVLFSETPVLLCPSQGIAQSSANARGADIPGPAAFCLPNCRNVEPVSMLLLAKLALDEVSECLVIGAPVAGFGGGRFQKENCKVRRMVNASGARAGFPETSSSRV